MTKYLSFDIGIKHLAYSVVELSQQKTLTRVVDWGIVNLIEDQQETSTCSVEGCGNRAFKSVGRGVKKHICCKNKRCQKAMMETWGREYPKSKATVQPFRPKKATAYSLIGIASAMKRWVEAATVLSDIRVDRVLMEHQPVFRNPVMKSVQMILVGILVGTGFTTEIEFVHAGKKTTKTETYGERKGLSVAEIQRMLAETPEVFPEAVRETWQNSRKRDDLADTVNQAVAWAASH